MATFAFDSTGEAYDSTMCNDSIATGDTLLIREEGVVGLAWAWPVAITEAFGAFHTIEPGYLKQVLADAKITPAQVQAAIKVAQDAGFAVRSEYLEV